LGRDWCGETAPCHHHERGNKDSFMASLRLERVRELLKREIGEVIRRELPVNEAGVISVNDVDVSGDLHSAIVFISILGSKEQQKHGFEVLVRERKRIQGLVARSVVLKYTPTLKFLMDDSVLRGNRFLDILEELEKTTPSLVETDPEDEEFGTDPRP